MIDLPKEFIENITEILPEEEIEAFLESYNKEPKKGIRANTLKISKEELKTKLPEEFQAEDILWCSDGLYIDSESRPGKRPEYYSGLYYPQEPSAMSSAEALDLNEGDLVLDLCAAPGGKSTQLAAKLGENGALVLNEIVRGRVPALASNVERMGIKNAIILNENPSKLVKKFSEAFDKILIDAPCSGEGMFRKDNKVVEEWSPERPEQSSRKQKKILDTVDQLLKPGGEIVYSTCTFSPKENEEVISYLISSGNYDLLPLELNGIETTGIDKVLPEGSPSVTDTVRIWPHKNEGEGHFVAKLRKKGEPLNRRKRNYGENSLIRKTVRKKLKPFLQFKDEYMPDFNEDNLFIFKNHLIQLPSLIKPEDLESLKVVSAGLDVGEFKTNRFEPSHSLAMSLKKEEFNNTYEMTEDELWHYLKGEEIKPTDDPKKGWVLMCYDGYPVGFGKFSGTIKNKYPKGLRIYKK